MKLMQSNITQELNELFLIETLNLDNKTILELGCGDAQKTKTLASNGENRKIIACEVDKIQHNKNLELKIDNINFLFAGAENIPLEDSSIDMVFMFKSFHHVAIELMQKSLDEIKRVLKTNGLVYISEPLFQGDLNELIAMYHNEEYLREKAFDNIKKAVEENKFKLFKEIFFYSLVEYDDFNDFKKKMIDATYNKKVLSKEHIEKIQNKFESLSRNKAITFKKPFRVDILQKID